MSDTQQATRNREAAYVRTSLKQVRRAQREALEDEVPLRLSPMAGQSGKYRALDDQLRTLAIGELVFRPDEEFAGIAVFRPTEQVRHI
jgi:hypothetical protein